MSMKILKLFFFFCFFVFYSCTDTSSSRPLSLYEAKEKIQAYYQKGRYQKDIKKQVSFAKKYILRRLQTCRPNEKLAAIFDIDDTAISHLDFYIKQDFQNNFTITFWEEYFQKNSFLPLFPLLDLYNFAKKKGIALFFISSRHEKLRETTIANLKHAGYSGWKKIYLSSPKNPYPSSQAYKTHMRQKIIEDGYSIIINIGDQKSDLLGGFCETTYLLPNPIYLIR